jgi:hypothetical protein
MQVDAVAAQQLIPTQQPSPPAPPPQRSFADLIAGTVIETARDVEQRGPTLDAMVKQAMKGNLSNGELLALQVAANRYSLEVDLLSKIVQQAVQGLRDLLKTQV